MKYYEVVCAVIIKDDKIFITKRGSKGECAFKWEFPGGKIENGETHEQALVREIFEELSSKIAVNDYINTVNYEYQTFKLTMHAYYCTLLEGSLSISEHLDAKWIYSSDLINYDFAPADKPIIEILMSRNNILNERSY